MKNCEVLKATNFYFLGFPTEYHKKVQLRKIILESGMNFK